jgi:hypothetical protein
MDFGFGRDFAFAVSQFILVNRYKLIWSKFPLLLREIAFSATAMNLVYSNDISDKCPE